MAAIAQMINSSGVAGRSDEIYIATTPLRGTKGPPQFFLSTAFSLGTSWDLQHFMLIIKPSSSFSQAVVFDFQPEDPENIYVALAALSGRSVPGAILERKISKVPKKKCWLVGSAIVDALEEARKFNGAWETDLRIGHHDCRDYVNGEYSINILFPLAYLVLIIGVYCKGLAEVLTGEKLVLEQLRHISRDTNSSPLEEDNDEI
ncbi:hypothetical protein V2J09_002693 [Rumex salicifolius]